jgi:bifunctional non-homologous end joining protein LigD
MTESMPILSVIAAPVAKILALLERQLCTLVEQPPSGADWLHEIKYDGWRLLGRKHGDDVRLYTRGGIETCSLVVFPVA